MFTDSRPLIGVPFRALKEEEDSSKRAKIEPYLRAVAAAGGHPVEISLRLPREKLESWAAQLDAILLPGSAADVDPAWYHAERHPACADSDPHREQTDFALLDAAFAARKPVLAICYGVQLLNVYLGGTLVQDIASEVQGALKHDWEGRSRGVPEPFHPVQIDSGSRLAALAGSLDARVNSSHHQALSRAARGLRVVARAPDGIIEAVEFTGDGPWILGVQWHPERMWPAADGGAQKEDPGDALAAALFRELVAAARKQAVASH